MTDRTLVDTAMLLAIEAHGGDRNKHDGEMYTLHLARVWMNVRNAGGDEVQQAIAWLHDSVEDTTLTYVRIANVFVMYGDDVAQRIVSGVRGMTKIDGESDEDYYRRCKENPDSRFVKRVGDMVDNFRRNHKITDQAKRLKFGARYSLGMDILT